MINAAASSASWHHQGRTTMKQSACWFAGLVLMMAACRTGAGSSHSAAVPAPAVADTALRSELLRMGAEDQAGREDLPNAVARNDTAVLFRFLRGDSVRTRRLKEIVAQRGWVTPALVGKGAVDAAWLVLQHSPDNHWQEQMLPTLERAALAGDLSRADVSALTDRVLVHQGKPQRYGNSFSIRNGRLVPDPIDDIGGLDSRRAALGLLPMAEMVRLMGEAYKMPVDWPPPKR
jgi:hypothetical protein